MDGHGKTLDSIGKDFTSDCFRESTRSNAGGWQYPPRKGAVWTRGLGVSSAAVRSWVWPSLVEPRAVGRPAEMAAVKQSLANRRIHGPSMAEAGDRCRTSRMTASRSADVNVSRQEGPSVDGGEL